MTTWPGIDSVIADVMIPDFGCAVTTSPAKTQSMWIGGGYDPRCPMSGNVVCVMSDILECSFVGC